MGNEPAELTFGNRLMGNTGRIYPPAMRANEHGLGGFTSLSIHRPSGGWPRQI